MSMNLSAAVVLLLAAPVLVGLVVYLIGKDGGKP